MQKLLPLLAIAALLGYGVYYFKNRVTVTVEQPPAPVAEEVKPAEPSPPAVDPPLVEALQLSLLNADSHGKIESLLQGGADPNALDLKGHPAIYWAIANSDAKALELMIKAGADLNKADTGTGWTPLMHASYYAARDPKLAKLVHLLLANKADAKASANGVTPLHVVITNAADDEAGAALVKELLKGGADPEAEASGITPLADAARSGKIRLAKALVLGGAKLDHKGPGGKTPAEIAADNKHPELAQALQIAAARSVPKKAAPAPAKPKKKKQR